MEWVFFSELFIIVKVGGLPTQKQTLSFFFFLFTMKILSLRSCWYCDDDEGHYCPSAGKPTKQTRETCED